MKITFEVDTFDELNKLAEVFSKIKLNAVSNEKIRLSPAAPDDFLVQVNSVDKKIDDKKIVEISENRTKKSYKITDSDIKDLLKEFDKLCCADMVKTFKKRILGCNTSSVYNKLYRMEEYNIIEKVPSQTDGRKVLWQLVKPIIIPQKSKVTEVFTFD